MLGRELRTNVLSTNARAVVFTVDVLLALSVADAAAAAEAELAAAAEALALRS